MTVMPREGGGPAEQSSSANADDPVFRSAGDQLRRRGVLDARFRGHNGYIVPACHALSYTEQSLAPQVRKQWQQRQTEDGEMIAFDPLEQVNAEPFKLIGADT